MQVKCYQNQADAVRAGSNRWGTFGAEVDVSKLTEGQRRMLAKKVGFHESTFDLENHTQDEAGVIARLDELLEKEVADKAELEQKVEEAVQKFLDMTPEQFNVLYIGDYESNPEHQALANPRLAAKVAVRVAYRQGAAARDAAEVAAQRAATEEIYKANRLAAEERERLAAERQALAAAVVAAWAAEHGSERLKLALAGEYKCNKLYLQERVALELGEGWVVDTGDNAETEERCNPSLEALKAIQVLPEGYEGEVVWLTTPPTGHDQDYNWEPCEAVEVTLPYSNHRAYHSYD